MNPANIIAAVIASKEREQAEIHEQLKDERFYQLGLDLSCQKK
jgi:hypothetical protein